MLKIFLSSHGRLASGIKSSLNILMGNSDNLTVFDAYVDERNVADVLDEFYSTVTSEDQVLLLADLYGGSVSNKMYEYLTKENTYLISGVNLALVLELCMKQEISEAELEEQVEMSRSMMKVLKLEKTDVEEEDFF